MRRALLSVLLFGPAVLAARYVSPWEGPSGTPTGRALLLHPLHERVYLLEVAVEGAEQFEAPVLAKVPTKGAKSAHVVEVGPNFSPLRECVCQVTSDGLPFIAHGLTRPGKVRKFLCFLDFDEDAGRETKGDFGPPPPSGPLWRPVAEAEGAILVRTAYFEIAHPERGAGGLPSKVRFLHSGVEEDGFFWDDRVYKKGLGFFALRSDPEAVARVVERGPVRVVVEARARYFEGGKGEPAPGNARATYRFEYFSTLPIVKVEAKALQEKPLLWPELHFFQLSIRGTRFPIWRAEGREGRFTGSKRVEEVQNWAAMMDSENAMGLVIPEGKVKVYDDPWGYCNYVHGPWLRWRSKEAKASCWLYFGPSWAVELWAERARELPLLAEARELEGLEALRRGLRLRSPERASLERWLYRLTLRDYALGRLSDEKAAERARDIPDMARQFKSERGVSVLRTGKSLLLATSQVRLALDLESGGIVGLSGREGPEFVTRPEERPPLWEIEVRREDGKVVKADSACSRPEVGLSAPRQGEAEILLRWRSVKFEGVDGEVSVTARLLVADALRARISVENRLKNGGLWRVHFPIVKGLGDPGGCDLAVPRGNHGRLHRSASGRFGGGYPSGGWPMQFLSLTMGGWTLYLACHDGLSSLKWFSLDVGRDFRFTFAPPNMTVPGADFEQEFDAVLKPLGGDWFDACFEYRRWALKQRWAPERPVKDRDTPEGFKRICLWICENGPSEKIVPGMERALSFFRVPMGLHWYCWHQIPFDNDYPHYFPARPGFEEAVRRLVGKGLFVMPYINGRLWDSDTPDFPQALPYATKGLDGKFYIEIYGSGEKLVPMCPSTKFWGDKLAEIVEGLVKRGVNAVYIDQVAAAGPRLCFDRGHGHPLGGGHWWVDGYYRILRRIRAIAPGRLAMTSENNCEAYMRWFDAYLTWTWRHPDMAPLYDAVYGDRILRFASPATSADDGTAFRIKVGRDLLWGVQLGWMGFWLLEPRHRPKAEFLRRMAELRGRALDFLAFGRMLRAPRWALPVPTVRCRWQRGPNWFEEVEFPALERAAWRAPDGKVGVLVVNFDERPHLALLSLEGLELPEGRVLPLEASPIGGMPLLPMEAGKGALEVCLKPSSGKAVSLLPMPDPKRLSGLALQCLSDVARNCGLRPPKGPFGSLFQALRTASALKKEAIEKGAEEAIPALCHWERLLALEWLRSKGVELTPKKDLSAVAEGGRYLVGSIEARNQAREPARISIRALFADPALGSVTPKQADILLRPGERASVPVAVSPPLSTGLPRLAVAKFAVSVAVGDEAVGFILPFHLELLPALEARLLLPSRARAGETARATLLVKVNANEPLPGRLLLDLPTGWAVEPSPSFPLSEFSPGEEARIPLLFHLSPGAEAGRARVKVRWARDISAGGVEVEPPRKEARAARLQKPLTIDGDLSDWPKCPEIALDGREGNNVKGWAGPEDLSAKAELAWDEGALYFGAAVKDDVHRQDFEGFDIWRGDCIQIGFDPFLDTESGYDGNDVEIGLALTKSGPQTFLWFPGPARACSEARVSVKRQGRLTIYEARLPWRLLGLHPRPGLRLGFSFTVNESDNGSFDGWLEWTPGICGGKDASRFGALVLE